MGITRMSDIDLMRLANMAASEYRHHAYDDSFGKRDKVTMNTMEQNYKQASSELIRRGYVESCCDETLKLTYTKAEAGDA